MAEKLSEKDIENINIEGTEEYAVMPLRNTVLFPQQVIPIYIGREKSLKLISDIELEKRKYIIVVAQEDGSIEDPSTEDLYSYGTLATVLKVYAMPDNSKSAIVQGIARVKILDYLRKDPYFKAAVSNEHKTVIEIARKTSDILGGQVHLIDWPKDRAAIEVGDAIISNKKINTTLAQFKINEIDYNAIKKNAHLLHLQSLLLIKFFLFLEGQPINNLLEFFLLIY